MKQEVAVLCSMFTGLLLVACSPEGGNGLQKTDTGIILAINDPDQNTKLIRVEVFSDDIVRVTATAADSFSTEESLMLVPAARTQAAFEVAESEDDVTLSTKTLKARIIRTTGAIHFEDRNGQVLLAEQSEGGKSFIPNVVDGQQYYTIQQKFLSPPDEALYGLGGHQNGQMNYKNDDVELGINFSMSGIPYWTMDIKAWCITPNFVTACFPTFIRLPGRRIMTTTRS